MTVPAVSLTPRPDPGLGAGASARAILELAARDDFHRWEAQLAATGHCVSPVRLQGRIDAIDRATGQARVMYDTDTNPEACCATTLATEALSAILKYDILAGWRAWQDSNLRPAA
jgi:hypothetical protein